MTGFETPWDAPGMAAACEEMWATDYEMNLCRQLTHLMATHLAGQRWHSAADIGCGTGRLYPAVRDCLAYAGGYLGIDASSRMLAVAQRRYPMAEFRLGNLLDGLPYPPQQFDLVVCSAVLGHLAELRPALTELWRLARHALFFTLWATDEPAPLVGVDLGNMRKVFYPLPMIWTALGALTEHRGTVRGWPLSDGSWAWLVRR